MVCHSPARAPGCCQSSPGGVLLRSFARALGCYQCSPGGVALHSFARAPGPPHSSPGAWYFALPRAALVPLRARGRGASLVRPRAGPPTCGTLVSAAGLAQLVEQLSCKQQVIGSSPIAGSIVQCTWIRPVVWLALAGWPVFPLLLRESGCPVYSYLMVGSGCAGTVRVDGGLLALDSSS